VIYLLNLLGLVLIAIVVWWFWFAKREKAVKAKGNVIDIAVENGVYAPETIEVSQHQTVILRFTRRDESPCSGTVVFAEFDQSADLPLNTAVEVTLQTEQPGKYEFTCQMGMYRGTLIVV
jgi:plastocyanin domain-containing protein